MRVWRRRRSGRGERGGKTNVTTTTAAAATTGLRENIYNIIISLFVFFYRSGEYYLSSRCPRSLCFTTVSRASASECVCYVCYSKDSQPPARRVFARLFAQRRVLRCYLPCRRPYAVHERWPARVVRAVVPCRRHRLHVRSKHSHNDATIILLIYRLRAVFNGRRSLRSRHTWNR